MSLFAKRSTTHQHLTRRVFKKLIPVRDKDAESNAADTKSGFGKLEIGKEALTVQAAYKPIFGL